MPSPMQVQASQPSTHATGMLHYWRTRLLNGLLLALVLLGLPALIQGILSDFATQPEVAPMTTTIYIVIYGIIVLATFWRQLTFSLRALVLIGLFYTVGAVFFSNTGLYGDSRPFLFCFAIVATALFGVRGGVLAILLTTLTMGLFGWLFTTGTLALRIDPVAAATDPFYWTSATLSMLVAMAAAVIVSSYLLRQLQDLINGLEQQVAQRTAQLAQAVDEAQAARTMAEQANEMKTRFIANMSHELRTPLNAILNFTYIIKSGVRGPVTDDQIEYLDRVYASGEHLLGMINDILDLAKIEAGRMELFTEALNLGELARSTLSSAVGLTKDKPIELHSDIAPDLPLITADKTRIRQVLLNLLSNAAKFTDEGTITIRVRQQGDALITSVSDTGIGIPADKLDTVFEEFRQADEGSERSYQGTGLGLPICQRLVAMHGGRIWVASEVGVGSTFSFSLPLEQLPFAEDEPPADGAREDVPDEQAINGVPVLVIDDDPAVVEIVRSYLAPEGYQIFGFPDGSGALEEAARLQPAAIILDILLPHQDGWELLTRFQQSPALRHIPIICYTVVDNPSLGLTLGARAYLVKPIQPEILRETIAQLVAQPARVLVIDDDPQMHTLVRDYLEPLGYQVASADDGRVGLSQVAGQPPDLILLDLMMPEMDGFTVLNKLADNPMSCNIPVVVITAKDLNETERAFLQQRVRGLVHKQSEQPEQWLARLRDVLPAAATPAIKSKQA